MSSRGHAATRSAPGAFRCLVCKIYVVGTEAGHCPRCGFVPPNAPPAVEPANALPWPLLLALIAILLVVIVASAL